MKQIDHTSVFTVIEHIKSLATLNNTSGKVTWVRHGTLDN
jgi:hypothetical protein